MSSDALSRHSIRFLIKTEYLVASSYFPCNLSRADVGSSLWRLDHRSLSKRYQVLPLVHYLPGRIAMI